MTAGTGIPIKPPRPGHAAQLTVRGSKWSSLGNKITLFCSSAENLRHPLLSLAQARSTRFQVSIKRMGDWASTDKADPSGRLHERCARETRLMLTAFQRRLSVRHVKGVLLCTLPCPPGSHFAVHALQTLLLSRTLSCQFPPGQVNELVA